MGERSGDMLDGEAATPSRAAAVAPPVLDLDRLPPALVRELRASHVGETVAVRLYDGVAAGSRDPALLRFAASHRAVERHHLRLFEAVLPPERRSRLMGFWRWGGFVMGWLPARLGAEAFYAVVASVEGWVDGHYARQIALARRLAPDPALLALLEACRADEAQHSREAADHLHRPGPAARILARLAVACSAIGVAVARRV